MINFFSYNKFILSYIVLFFIANLASSQNKDELERRKVKTEQEIKNANTLLAKTKKLKQAGYNDLLVINRKIKIQEELIETVKLEINYLTGEIRNLQDTINELEVEMEVMKKEYAELMIQAYKRRNKFNVLIFIFSAEDVNQAFSRIKYLQQYEKYSEKKANEIIEKNSQITKKLEALSLNKAEKGILLKENIILNSNLKNDKVNKNNIVKNLKDKEKELLRKIIEKRRIAEKLKQEIKRIIEEEIRKAEEIARRKNKSNLLLTLTPEEKLLSDNFEENKRKLPWPTERGIITGEFGIQEHPVLKGIKIKNDGIDISTTQGSYARSVFKGVVAKIVYLPGINKVILIRHGHYFTVYTNLDDVLVKVNDEVKEKQLIGKIHTDIKEENRTYFNFQIWKETQKLNPAEWIAR